LPPLWRVTGENIRFKTVLDRNLNAKHTQNPETGWAECRAVHYLLGCMSISRPTKTIISGLIFGVQIFLIAPALSPARAGQVYAPWDAFSYTVLVFLVAPLFCVWFGAGRNRLVEVVGWFLLLLLTVSALLWRLNAIAHGYAA
jgi:hypothetical protein